jgi:purine-binding chemotaxis protein CheW
VANQQEPQNQQPQPEENSSPQEELAGKYLTFFLAGQEFGVEITKVREILRVLDITPVPQTAHFLLGVINLRGKVIPVIDLRLRLGHPSREPDERTCIVVVEVKGREGQNILISMMVDQVNEVLQIAPEEVEPAPPFGTEVDTNYILGMAKTAQGVKILLDVDRIINESVLVEV